MNLLKLLRNTIIFLMGLLIVLILILVIPYSEIKSISYPERECIDIKDITSFEYSACYDAFTKSIFLELKNNNFTGVPKKIKFSFFDYSPQSSDIEIPNVNESSIVRVSSERNPFMGELFLLDKTGKYCPSHLDLQIKYCTSTEGETDNISIISLITDSPKEDFTIVIKDPSDTLALSLVDKERIWESICKSAWDCGSWTDCIDGLQRRECMDKNNCKIPTNSPQRVRSCEGVCDENWKCDWSECVDGFTTPLCEDLNRCGTSVNKPSRVPCINKCTPDFVCSEWTNCIADYDFLTFSNGNYSLSGRKSRTCIDKNKCQPETKEFSDCLLVIDVYTAVFEKCNKEYIGIYNRLDNSLLANIEKNNKKNVLNIDLGGVNSEFYCDYCFDGIFNGDEEQIDCGGSCPPCSERYVYSDYSKNIFEKSLEYILNIFS
jgi:hypothetical protein